MKHLVSTRQGKAPQDIDQVWQAMVQARKDPIPPQLYGETRGLLVRFARNFVLDLDQVWQAEAELAVDKNGLPIDYMDPKAFVRGRADLVLVDGLSAEIQDWKSSWVALSEKELRDDLQAQTYAMLLAKMNPALEEVRVRFVYPRTGAAPVAIYYPNDIEEAWQRWRGIHEMLERAVADVDNDKLWPATPGKHCARCFVAARCPLGMVQQGQAIGVPFDKASADALGERLSVLKAAVKVIEDGLKNWATARDAGTWSYAAHYDAKEVAAIAKQHFIDPMRVLRVDVDALHRIGAQDVTFMDDVAATLKDKPRIDFKRGE